MFAVGPWNPRPKIYNILFSCRNSFSNYPSWLNVRVWSLFTGRGLKNEKVEGGGGHVKFYPYKKGGGDGKSFSHAKGGGGGGGITSFEVVLTRELEVLARVMWGGGARKKLPPFTIPCPEGGGGKKFRKFPIL